MKAGLEFSIAYMPGTRPADYHLSCLGGSVFIDFDDRRDGRICLIRISFDKYGCCDLEGEAIPMDEIDSNAFKEIVRAPSANQSGLSVIIRKTIANNRGLIWEDALTEYDLLM